MKIDKKRVSTVFALTLLIVSLLLANMNGPSSVRAAPVPPSPRVVEVCGVDITNVTVTRCGTPVTEGYKTWTTGPNTVPVTVTVTVHNNSTSGSINCTVSAYYYNATFTQQIGTSQNINNLPPCNTTTLTFSLNCLNLPVGVTYTVKANATCTCGASDEFVNGNITKRRWGDVKPDGYVSAGDIVKVILIIRGEISKPYYPPYMPDVNGDCWVSAADITKIILIIRGVLTERDC